MSVRCGYSNGVLRALRVARSSLVGQGRLANS